MNFASVSVVTEMRDYPLGLGQHHVTITEGVVSLVQTSVSCETKS